MMASKRTIKLTQNWTFRATEDPSFEYLETQGFPTEIHLDLMHHGLIPDPFPGKNEEDVQWVGEKSWTYRKTFDSPDVGKGEKVVLCFDGLDTFATVKLDGLEILKTQDMFIPERVDITDVIRSDQINSLEIAFESAYLRGRKIREEQPNHHWGCWNGDSSRLAVRKAQYHYV